MAFISQPYFFKMELKTLKDFEWIIENRESHKLYNEIKQEAIKWVKEDKMVIKSLREDFLLSRWMKRLNITEEDLK